MEHDELMMLQEQLHKLKDHCLMEKTREQDLLQRKEAVKAELQKIHEQVDLLEKVRVLLQETAAFSREQARQQVEWLVTNALQAIFGSDLSFQIEMRQTKNRTEADFFVVSVYEGRELKVKPEQARGGGVVDIVSLALRFAIIHLFQPIIEGPIILDEPAKHVSEEYIAQVGEFLKNISAYFDRQVIMVTHNNYLSELADTAYRIEMREGQSVASVLKKAAAHQLDT